MKSVELLQVMSFVFQIGKEYEAKSHVDRSEQIKFLENENQSLRLKINDLERTDFSGLTRKQIRDIYKCSEFVGLANADEEDHLDRFIKAIRKETDSRACGAV